MLCVKFIESIDMTQEEKQLLLKDLCSRLPYGVICHTEEGDGYLCSINQTIFGTEYGLNINPLKRDYFNDSETDEQAVKPYLRTMLSMTQEERLIYEQRLHDVGRSIDVIDADDVVPHIDWLLSRHFDFRGLIPMGLALEATVDMYKTE